MATNSLQLAGGYEPDDEVDVEEEDEEPELDEPEVELVEELVFSPPEEPPPDSFFEELESPLPLFESPPSFFSPCL